MEKYTRNFSVAEMACRCGQCPGGEVMDPLFMQQLQELRDFIAAPLIITSGYRCLAYNQSLPRASTWSYHLRGRAADISLSELDVEGSVSRFRSDVVSYAFRCNLYGIGLSTNFIHLDSRGFSKRRMWVYS